MTKRTYGIPDEGFSGAWFGSTRLSSGTSQTDRLYTGQQFRGGVGLYNYGARLYDPYLNRFIQPDTIVPNPANPQAFNRYSYAYNNPLKYVDSDGRFPLLAVLLIAGVGGTGLAWLSTPSTVKAPAPGDTPVASDYASQEAAILGASGEDIRKRNYGALAVGAINYVPGGRLARFAGASPEILRGVSALINRMDVGPWTYRRGLEAQLKRAEEYFKAGKLKAVEFTEGHNRYDLVPESDEVVEIKLWRQSYAVGHMDDVVDRLKSYQGAGRDVILESVKTKTDTIGDDFLNQLWQHLKGRGIEIARENIRLVD